jgi:hypothetical protein
MSRATLETVHVIIESTKSAVEVRFALESAAAPELKVALRRDHGAIARYEVGGRLVESMTSYATATALYVPLRVIVYERDGGGSRIEYDLPSSLFGQFGDERVTEVALGLDVALGRALSAAAG